MKRLVVFSGIPATGKSTLSKMYAERVGALWLSVDPVEGAMKLSGVENNYQLGVAAYRAVSVIADQNLEMNRVVVIDAVNPTKETRKLWRELAKQYDAQLDFVECVTINKDLHKERVEKRVRNIPGMRDISWEKVQFRASEYQPWNDKRIVLQTDKSIQESFKELLVHLS